MAETQGNENILGAVAYLVAPLTSIVLLLVDKRSKLVRFHAMQATIFSVAFWALIIVLGFIPVLGWILLPVVWLAGFALWLLLMWKAFQGEMYKVPYVGALAERQIAKMG